jgi:hypothetical protein
MTYETRNVLAAAYTARNPHSMLSHSVEVDDAGDDVRVLCRRVKLESAVCDDVAADAVPTCPVCAARLAKLTA